MYHGTDWAIIAMDGRVTCRTEGNQVPLRIGPGMTAKPLMVNLQVRHCAAGLTPPAVSL